MFSETQITSVNVIVPVLNLAPCNEHIALNTWFCCTYHTWGSAGPLANLDFVEERKMSWPCKEL